MASHSKLDKADLTVWFEPNQKEGTIICHRRRANGQMANPVIYNIDSSHPALDLLNEEERASFIAARDLLGWKDQSPKMTNMQGENYAKATQDSVSSQSGTSKTTRS